MSRFRSPQMFLLMAVALRAQTTPATDDTPPPLESEQKKILAQITENALKYGKELPDFVANKITRRNVDQTGTSQHWRLIDTTNEELTYAGHTESYKVLTLNGKKADRPERQGISTSSGEFGNLMSWIFDPKAQAEFKWNTWATLSKRRMYVFTYSVAEPQSQFTIGTGKGRMKVAFFGAVFADVETARVMRITVVAKSPAKFALQNVSLTLDYDYSRIGEQQVLLPLKSDFNQKNGKSLIWNEVEFRRYRKAGLE